MTVPLPPNWRRLRVIILNRDEWTCQIAGPGCTRDATQVDHAIPRAQWPKDRPGCHHPSNLRATCKTCHNARSKSTPSSVMAWREMLGIR